jgi:isopenicillin N synthase-like dioxygenase
MIAKISYADPEAAKKFAQSLCDTGFAVITHHPISADTIFSTYDRWSQFFRSEEKHQFTFKKDEQSGYFPFKSEKAKDASVADLKEFFHIYPDTLLPDDTAPLSRELYAKLQVVATQLLGWLDQETPNNVKARWSMPLTEMIRETKLNLLRILHYPPIENQESSGAVRAAAHEDINLITLLVAASAPGLQVQDAQGQWYDVPSTPGDIVVNAGDMLQEVSDGFYKSTTHRVVNPTEPELQKTSRYSMPLFVHPRPEVVLSQRHTAGTYLEERLRELTLK